MKKLNNPQKSMWNYQKNIFLIVSILLLPAIIFGKDEMGLYQQKYDFGVESFNKAEYGESIAMFRELVSLTPTSQIGLASRFMLGMISYKTGKYNDAITQFTDFIGRQLPISETFWSGYYIANIYFQQKNYYDSAKWFIWTMRTNDPILKNSAKNSLENLLWGYLTMDEIQRLRRSNAGQVGEDIISFYIVKRLDYDKSRNVLFDEAKLFLEHHPESEKIKDVKQVLTKVEEELGKEIVIAVLLPFTGKYATYGQEIYNGIELAMRDYQKYQGKNVVLEKIDTNGDPLVASLELKKFLNKKIPLVIIGPLRSESAIAVGILASQYGVPMITPSASREGISSVGDAIYQLSPSLEDKCRALASYSLSTLACSTFAIIAPDDDYGKRAGKSFSERFKNEGGKLVGEQYYPEGMMDLSAPLDSIKAPMIKQMTYWSTKADTTDTVFYDKFHKLKEPDNWIIHIDGFFIPNYSDELENVLPQIPFNYFDTKFFGALGWNEDLANKSSTKDYVNGAIFTPDEFYIDNDSNIWKDFSRTYKSNYKGEPGRLAGVGYDSAKLIIAGLNKGALIPSIMKDFLSGVKDFQGVSGNITFSSYGANIQVPILKFDGKKVIRLQ